MTVIWLAICGQVLSVYGLESPPRSPMGVCSWTQPWAWGTKQGGVHVGSDGKDPSCRQAAVWLVNCARCCGCRHISPVNVDLFSLRRVPRCRAQEFQGDDGAPGCLRSPAHLLPLSLGARAPCPGRQGRAVTSETGRFMERPGHRVLAAAAAEPLWVEGGKGDRVANTPSGPARSWNPES